MEIIFQKKSIDENIQIDEEKKEEEKEMVVVSIAKPENKKNKKRKKDEHQNQNQIQNEDDSINEWCVQNITENTEIIPNEGFEYLIPEEQEEKYIDCLDNNDVDKYLQSLSPLRQQIIYALDKKVNNLLQTCNIEIGIHNYTIQEANRQQIVKKWINKLFLTIYLSKSKSILYNLHPEIIQQLQNGDLLSQKIAFMTHQELLPDIWKDAIEKKNKKDAQKYETKLVATTNTFTCFRCGSNQCNHYLLQTRSSDEPMTCYVTCLNCGKKWKS
jgi:DNA-directed RNA polymerase subunit M/transcription elongation factor TFIIS